MGPILKRWLRSRQVLLALLALGSLASAGASLFNDQPGMALGLGAIGGVLTVVVAMRLERGNGVAAQALGAHPKVWALPQRLRYFTGRQDDLDGLETVLSEQRRPDIAVLWGIGAVGKTSMALEYAHRVHDQREFTAWISAGERYSVLASLAEMGRTFGVTIDDQKVAAKLALEELQRREPFLIVYDNATPDSVRGLLPVAGDGDVLITSRSDKWDDIGTCVPLEPFDPVEAVDLLLTLSGDKSRDARIQASALAHRLGYLPLSLDLAGKYCRNNLTLAQYNTLLEQCSQVKLKDGQQLAARLSVARVARRNTAAVQLLRLLSYLAPGYIPQELVTANAHCLPLELRLAIGIPDQWRETVNLLQDAGLIRVETGRLWVHQAVQDVERAAIGMRSATRLLWLRTQFLRLVRRADRTVGWSQERWLQLAVSLLLLEFPAQESETVRWDRFADLLPHATAVLGELKDDSPVALPAAHLSGLVAGYLLEGRNLKSARALLERVVVVRQRVQGREHVETLSSRHNLAMVNRGLGDLLSARAMHQAVMEARTRILGRDHEETLISMSCLASVLELFGDEIPAKVLREQVAEAHSRVAARHDRSLASDRAGVRRELRGAQSALRREWDLRERVLGPGHPDTLISMVNLAGVTKALGELKVAHELLESALEVSQNLLGLGDPLTLMALSDLADLLAELGDLSAARQRYEQLLVELRRKSGDEHQEVLRSMSHLAGVLLHIGDLAAAKELSERVLEMRRRVLGVRHPETLESISQLADILDKHNDPGAAAELRKDLD